MSETDDRSQLVRGTQTPGADGVISTLVMVRRAQASVLGNFRYKGCPGAGPLFRLPSTPFKPYPLWKLLRPGEGTEGLARPSLTADHGVELFLNAAQGVR